MKYIEFFNVTILDLYLHLKHDFILFFQGTFTLFMTTVSANWIDVQNPCSGSNRAHKNIRPRSLQQFDTETWVRLSFTLNQLNMSAVGEMKDNIVSLYHSFSCTTNYDVLSLL